MERTTAVYGAALSYVDRGWPVIAVHGLSDIDERRCTCGAYPCGRENRMAGKHPVHKGWQRQGLRSKADAYATWEEDGPDWNVGILTGTPSGLFALDVDSEAGGLEELARLEALHGPLPTTLTFGTGGGGRHLLFDLPDGVEVRNNQKKIAPGIDVRGTGGMIVAPPSVSGKGRYFVVVEADIVTPPGWLVDSLRTPDGIAVGEVVVIEDLPVWIDLSTAERARVDRYARTVLEREARAYVDAPPGTGNAMLFQAACNVLEIVQSPWNTLTEHDALHALEGARQLRITARRGIGGQDPTEFGKTYLSARGKVTGQGRPLPADPAGGVLFEPFPAAGTVAGGDSPTFVEPAGVVPPPQTPLERLRGALLTADQVKRQPPPKPLVVNWLDLDSEAWLIGAPGTYKSFVVLDLAGHVGRGMSWLGRRTTRGSVLYLVAEGAGGMTLRVKAWEDRYGSMEDVNFLPIPVQAADTSGRKIELSADWLALVDLARELDPKLVVIDTQARVTVGLPENGSEIGLYVEAVRRLREATGACVLTIHHTGRDGKNARGHSSIDGAQDTELKLERTDPKGRRVRLITEKQKNGADTAEAELELVEYDEGLDPETGRPLTSLVVLPASPFDQPKKERAWVEGLPKAEQMIATVLLDHTDHMGATAGDMLTMIKERFGVTMNRHTYNSARASLAKKELIVNGVNSIGSSMVTRWAIKARVDDFLGGLEV